MTLRLTGITFKHAPNIPGLRPGDMIAIQTDNPPDSLKGWRALVRGSSLFLISPDGWSKDANARRNAKPGDPNVFCQVPMSLCFLHWSGVPADVDSIAKFTSPPFEAPKPAVPVEDQALVPDGAPIVSKSLLDQLNVKAPS